MEVLKLPHKQTSYPTIVKKSIEVRLEKTLTQVRWSLMDKDKKDLSEEAERELLAAKEIYDHNNKTLDLAKKRPTAFKTVPSYKIPEPGKGKDEEYLQIVRSEVLSTAIEYLDKNTDDKGNLKTSNLTQDQNKGIQDLKKLINDKKAVVTITDKSGKLTVDSVKNYEVAMENHIKNDEVIDEPTKDKLEKECSDTVAQLVRIFNISGNHDRAREKASVISKNTPAPPSTS